MKQVYNKIYDAEKYEKVNKENKLIIKDFLQELKSQKKAEGTINQYANDLRILALWVLENVDNKSFLSLKKRDYRDFVLWCDQEWHMSSARINRLMSATRMLCSFLEDDEDEYEEYERSAAAKIKGLPKESRREILFISNELVQRLYDKFMQEERYKEATLLAILYESGCRKNEILQVRRDSITQEGNASNVVVGKRKKTFRVLYFDKTKAAFVKYEAIRDDKNQFLFATQDGNDVSVNVLYDWVVKWKKDLKELDPTGDYDNLNVHTFRHLFVEHMTDGTHWLCEDLNLGRVPIEKVKTLVHHSDVSTTDGYRSNNDDKDIEELFGIKL